ncbi:hypothetical protein JXR93_03440 [bacterium]|nr:hypothetical protein [bacterium]
MNKKFVVVLLATLFLFSCGKKKESIESIRADFEKNPTVKSLSILQKHYGEKNDIDNKIKILEIYLAKNPKDKYAKEDIGKSYAKKAEKLQGEEKMDMLIKATSYGYTNDLLSKELTSLISQKIVALEKENDSEKIMDFFKKVEKLPISKELRRSIVAKTDIIKNQKEFDAFYKPFKENFDKTSEDFIKNIFNNQGVTYDIKSGLFTLQGGAKVTKNIEDAKVDAISVSIDLLTILKYAIENNKRPPQGEDIEVIPLDAEALACNEGVLSEDKKTVTIICNLNILDLGKAFFSIRKQEATKKEGEEKKGENK